MIAEFDTPAKLIDNPQSHLKYVTGRGEVGEGRGERGEGREGERGVKKNMKIC